ncbi:MAG: alpha/beta hydrolase [Myxococcota bacterium]
MPTITLPQGTLKYEDVGQGPPVVFVHGLLVNGQLWRKVTPKLSHTARCIVPDLPLGSHAIPMNADADLSVDGVARLVGDFLDALDLHDVTLVGNDSGGAISQLVASRYGSRLGRLVLTTCDAYDVFPPKGFGYLRVLPYVPGLIAALAKGMLAVKALRDLPIAYGLLAKHGIPEDVVKSYIAPAARSAAIRRDVSKFARSVSPRVTLEAAEELAAFGRPMLLLWTPEDRFFPMRLADHFRRNLPNVTLETIEDAYVFVAEDQPEQVAAGIARFIAERTAASAA